MYRSRRIYLYHSACSHGYNNTFRSLLRNGIQDVRIPYSPLLLDLSSFFFCTIPYSLDFSDCNQLFSWSSLISVSFASSLCWAL